VFVARREITVLCGRYGNFTGVLVGSAMLEPSYSSTPNCWTSTQEHCARPCTRIQYGPTGCDAVSTTSTLIPEISAPHPPVSTTLLSATLHPRLQISAGIVGNTSNNCRSLFLQNDTWLSIPSKCLDHYCTYRSLFVSCRFRTLSNISRDENVPRLSLSRREEWRVKKNAVFRDVAPCGSHKNRRCVLRLLVSSTVVSSTAILVTLMTEAVYSSEMSFLTRAT
jgi:hypothetical protein